MAINPIKTPFTNMSFTPDVPSSSLGPNEYNLGQNVETDTRSIKSVLGDQYILDTIPGNIIFIEGGFRENDIWWYIVATSQGKWYAINDAGYTDITPIGIGNFTGYNTSTVITGSWNGNVLFLNDMTNPPMYLLPNTNVLYLYDNAPDNYIWNYYSDWSALSVSDCILSDLSTFCSGSCTAGSDGKDGSLGSLACIADSPFEISVS